MKARTLSPSNADQYVQIVREYGLPLTGLLTSTECLEFCDDQGAIVGFAGLQRAGTDALLRSLVVLPARQRSGFGSDIVAWVIVLLLGMESRDSLHLLQLIKRFSINADLKLSIAPVSLN
jgi:GNAT superfamily N-acetyltransferase